MIVGIDLGTTNSAVATMSPDGPRLIPNALGEVLTPSVVGIDDDGKLLVGSAARELQVTHPERCAAAFKRHMGSDWTVRLAGQEFNPEKLSSLVLKQLKVDAETHFDGPVTDAVITVPAYFNEHQRKATINAGQIAGWNVRRILNEPTAAAIAYGFHESDEEKILLVYDLGGGTFDVSIVDLFEGTVEVRSSSGDSLLGGEDFTAAMTARLLESRGYVFERVETEHPALVSRMRHQCEMAKRRLSSQEEATVRLPNASGEIPEDAPELRVSRGQFHKWTGYILSRTALPIRRALGDAGLKEEDVSEVLLVGGATRMPAVVEQLAARFGKSPRQGIDPDEVVALGAAVQAGLIARDENLEDLVVTDVAPFSLGVAVCKEFGMEHRGGYFLPIIHRNTTIPISRSQQVSTIYANQREIAIKVYQGENRRVEHNLLLAEFAIEGIPMGPPGQAVDIRFTYDLNGVLEVEGTVVETGKKVTHVIARHARGLNPEQIARAVEEMQALKTHPREETVNRFLLRRAERVYKELPMVLQKHLGELLDGFEAAMDLGEREAIDRYRAALGQFLDAHDLEMDDE